MNDLNIEEKFSQFFRAQVRRVLTQLDRDPDSQTFGCFDRNYWHYKIRDFPSGILQQGAFVLEHLRVHANEVVTDITAREWTIAALNSLSRQAEPEGSLAEYYPFEDSYPAAAFALYSASKILLDWQNQGIDYEKHIRWSGLRKLAKRLLMRSELEAANQYAAGLAALAMTSCLPKFDLNESLIEKHAERLFALQHSEGWFHEYGGPDFGYLSVTIDALVDYYDVRKDPRALAAIDKAVLFIAEMVGCDGELPWTLNARNTDYVVPYGLVRTAQRNPTASWVVEKIFSNINDTNHALWATDDRYHLHYIYSSVVRSIPYLKEMTSAEKPTTQAISWYPGCGYLVRNYTNPLATVYIGALKGGVLRVHSEDERKGVYDNCWRAYHDRKVLTTNWWSHDIAVELQSESVSIRGQFVGCNQIIATPVKHVVLRILAKLFAKNLTKALKKVMIFRRSRSTNPGFHRTIVFDDTARSIAISDEFSMHTQYKLVRSPRQNLRHVASADSFSVEENPGLQDYLDMRNEPVSSSITRKVSF